MKTSTALLAVSMAFGLVAPSFAASDAAWEQFAKEVRVACVKAGASLFEKARAVVDPHGSESFGLALLRGKAKGSTTKASVICVYDKKTKKVEVGGELPLAKVAKQQ